VGRLAGGSACPASPISLPAPTLSAACASKARVRARPSTSGSARCLCTKVELEAEDSPAAQPETEPQTSPQPCAVPGADGPARSQSGQAGRNDAQGFVRRGAAAGWRPANPLRHRPRAGVSAGVLLPISLWRLGGRLLRRGLSAQVCARSAPSLHALHPLPAPSPHPLRSARATLFVPELGEEYEVFCGRYPSPEAFKAAYGVEEVHGLHGLPAWPRPPPPPSNPLPPFPPPPPPPHLRRHPHPRPRLHPRPHPHL
jgi:hypothetical protein